MIGLHSENAAPPANRPPVLKQILSLLRAPEAAHCESLTFSKAVNNFSPTSTRNTIRQHWDLRRLMRQISDDGGDTGSGTMNRRTVVA